MMATVRIRFAEHLLSAQIFFPVHLSVSLYTAMLVGALLLGRNSQTLSKLITWESVFKNADPGHLQRLDLCGWGPRI